MRLKAIGLLETNDDKECRVIWREWASAPTPRGRARAWAKLQRRVRLLRAAR